MQNNFNIADHVGSIATAKSHFLCFNQSCQKTAENYENMVI